VFDNTNDTFLWVPNGSFENPGAQFNPTLAPVASLPLVFDTRALLVFGSMGGSSSAVSADLIATGPNIAIARNLIAVTVNGPQPGQQTQFRPATLFAAGASVGPGSNFEAQADTGYFNPTLGRIALLGDNPTLGFRVMLNGQPHYGYIEFDRRLATTAGGDFVLPIYQPIRWAYETTPNTPITVPSVPAVLAFGAAGIGAATLRRRPREE
jgi:hypothetical protein